MPPLATLCKNYYIVSSTSEWGMDNWKRYKEIIYKRKQNCGNKNYISFTLFTYLVLKTAAIYLLKVETLDFGKIQGRSHLRWLERLRFSTCNYYMLLPLQWLD